jgi:hypothetical protein
MNFNFFVRCMDMFSIGVLLAASGIMLFAKDDRARARQLTWFCLGLITLCAVVSSIAL